MYWRSSAADEITPLRVARRISRTQHTSHLKYRPDIDGLRAVAVLSVVAFHAVPDLFPGGFVGVDIFFVISGFLISSIIMQEQARGEFSFFGFYARRIRRIFPALSVVLLASLALGWVILTSEELVQLGQHIAAGAFFLSNFLLLGEAGYFDKAADFKPLLHLWSLGIEEQFYLVWPLLLWAAWKSGVRQVWPIAATVVVSFALNIYLISYDPIATFYLPLTRFWELGCGGLLAWIALNRQPAIGPLIANAASVLGCVLLGLSFWLVRPGSDFPGYWAALPVAGAVLVCLSGPSAWINRVVLSSAPAVWFGLISYSLYLWHWPLLSFARIVENGEAPIEIRLAAVLLAIALAWLSLHFIETPFRKRLKASQRIVVALCSALAVVGLLGVAVSLVDLSKTHGFENRLVTRKGFEHAIGSSLRWFEGKNHWLFLGNWYKTVQKMRLDPPPSAAQINVTRDSLARLAATATKAGVEAVMIFGPNKSTIYPEYLPDVLKLPPKRYASFFLDELVKIDGLKLIDPTELLREAKKSEGLLYWRTDSHWNHKGAFLVYAELAKMIGVDMPKVEFRQGPILYGDIAKMTGRKNFPVFDDDNWTIVWRDEPKWTENKHQKEEAPFGGSSDVNNEKPLSDKIVWVIGDSFTTALKPFINATFKEVHYLGHWREKLDELPEKLEQAERKPDLILVVRVERSF